MKFLKFETVQPKGVFVIPEGRFICYKATEKTRAERDSGTLTYSSGGKTFSVEVKDVPPVICPNIYERTVQND